MDRLRAHVVLRTHLPRLDWLWLGLRRRCRHCDKRYPCPDLAAALKLLADRHDHLGPA